MNDFITINNDGKSYTLEFTRETVAIMEKRGFISNELNVQPATQIPLLIWGAFNKHHRYVRQDEAEEIYNNMDRRGDFLNKLIEMYSNVVMEIFGGAEKEEEGDEGKNVTWEASF